jgi:hypothetical protein
MLELRPNCENCGTPLPPASKNAMICSFECTFCRTCVDDVLENVCPNCGGGFEPRPVRPANDWKSGAFLGNFPASLKPHLQLVDLAAHKELRARIGDRAPEDR